MIQVHFTFESEEIQAIINESGANDTAKTLMTIMFNQLMKNNEINIFRQMPMNVQKNGNHKEMVTTIVRLQLELVR